MFASSIAINEQRPGTARSILEGKANLFTAAATLGGALSDWEEQPPNWEYAYLQLHHEVVRIGVSTGGVVSVNGHPFAPDLALNVSVDAVQRSIRAAVSSTLRCGSCGRMHAAADLSANDYISLDVGVCPDDQCTGKHPVHDRSRAQSDA